MSLEGLPPELQLEIAGYLDYYDRKDLRFVCRALKSAIDHLDPDPESVVLYLNRFSLEHARDVIKHSKAAPQSKHLTLHLASLWKVPEELENWSHVTPWEIYYELPTSRAVRTIKSIFTRHQNETANWEQDLHAVLASVERVHTAYVGARNLGELSASESPILTNDERSNMEFLRELPSNLQRPLDFPRWLLTKCMEDHEQLREDQSSILYPLLRETLSVLFDRCSQLASVRVKAWYHWEPQYGSSAFRAVLARPYDEPLRHNQAALGFVQLLRAATYSAFSPRSLSTDCLSLVAFALVDQSARLSFARNLQEFTCEYADLDAKGMDMVAAFAASGGLVDMMRAMTGLRKLEVDLGLDRSINSPFHGNFSLSRLVGSSTWTNLTSVEIFNITASAQHAAAFLLRHRSTLHRLVLGDIRLSEGTFVELFTIVAGNMQSLQSATFYGYFGEGDCNTWYDFYWGDDSFMVPLKNYIINGGDSCPIPPS